VPNDDAFTRQQLLHLQGVSVFHPASDSVSRGQGSGFRVMWARVKREGFLYTFRVSRV